MIRYKKYFDLSTKVFKYSHSLWNPLYTNKNIVDSNSWFTINELHNPNYKEPIKTNFYKETDKQLIKCHKIRFYPNKKQQYILKNWFKSSEIMYNQTIKYLNGLLFNKQKLILNWRKLRTLLRNIKKNIIKKFNINAHILDESIKSACTSYKSAFTNYKRGNIKRFRVRYIKLTKPKKILHIEKRFVSKKINSFCGRIFKTPFKCENNYQLKNISNDFKIHYDVYSNRYTFLIPIEVTPIKPHNKMNTISLDPGIRTFMTGYSNKQCVNIGDGITTHLKKYINKIDKINNDIYATKKQIKKVEKRCYKKIENTINDMHWKSINYLTNNYNTIVMGNMSTKSIVSNKSNSNLPKIVKRVALLMRLYIYKQRMQFKCAERKIGYKEVDEAYTSKTCTKCALLNTKLGSSKIFKCPYCKQKIDRDINGARNIMINALY